MTDADVDHGETGETGGAAAVDRGDIEDLPPSSKLVYKTLEWNGRLTQQQIIEESLLSGRTVRDALGRLQERDIVEQDVYYRDARQNVYTLNGNN